MIKKIAIGLCLMMVGILSSLKLFNDSNTTASVGYPLKKTVGVSVHEMQIQNNYSQINDYGLTTVRDAIVWEVVEQKKGEYQFTDNGRLNYDEFVNKMTSNKIRPYIMLLYANKLYNDTRAINNDVIKEAYTKWAAATAKRYSNKNIIWEIYNEPNTNFFWSPQLNSAHHYTSLVKMVAPEIKKNDPSATIVAPALSGLGDGSFPWLEEAFKEGILDYIDAISVHPYRESHPERVIKDYANLKKLIAKYTDKEIPIISGEWGYSTVPNWNGKGAKYFVENETQQAQYIARMLLINQSQGIEKSIIYDWKNDGLDEGYLEHHFGLLYFDKDEPKKSGIAVKNLIKTLGDYKFLKQINTGNDEDYVFKYLNDKGDTAYAYWTTSSDHYFKLEGKIKGKIISMLGEKSDIHGKDMTLSITQSPSYLLED
ncbi:cellulase family glycosylhydrolase [Niallia taxi]|uniref:cellulase family glycosylhydrolase n=1 Tax=Niallia taxi TaxID=2499688 RepID=UPI002E208F4B|nr:cellulase family glycosylhydrolase [Niallia taxi]MED4039100.1 cellulase family glycosylhydrolase [Niallia taxi]